MYDSMSEKMLVTGNDNKILGGKYFIGTSDSEPKNGETIFINGDPLKFNEKIHYFVFDIRDYEFSSKKVWNIFIKEEIAESARCDFFLKKHTKDWVIFVFYDYEDKNYYDEYICSANYINYSEIKSELKAENYSVSSLHKKWGWLND